MKSYSKIQAPIQAIQWDESKRTLDESSARMSGCNGHVDRPDECTNLSISTANGSKYVHAGDWIVLDDGQFYVISNAHFQSSYYPTQPE